MLIRGVKQVFATMFAMALTVCAIHTDESEHDDLLEDGISQTQSGVRKDRGGTNGDYNYCFGTITCNPGEGDCDASSECNGGSVCGVDYGPNFGMPAGWDVCVLAHCTNGIEDGLETGVDCGDADCGACGGPTCGGANGDSDFCSTSCPCGQVGHGDCDNDSQCTAGLVCKNNVGASFGMPASWDNCVAAHCRNGVLDIGETGLDCGAPDCDGCLTPASCGNGVRDSGERCDDGNTVTETTCPTGQSTCVACNANCSSVLTYTALLSDQFDDGDLQTNTGGVGPAGWAERVLFGGTITTVESGGVVTIGGSDTVKAILSTLAVDPTGTTMTVLIANRPGISFGDGVVVGWSIFDQACCDFTVTLELRDDRVVFDIMPTSPFDPNGRYFDLQPPSWTTPGSIYGGSATRTDLLASIRLGAAMWSVDVTGPGVDIHQAGTYRPGFGVAELVAVSGSLRPIVIFGRENSGGQVASVDVVRP